MLLLASLVRVLKKNERHSQSTGRETIKEMFRTNRALRGACIAFETVADDDWPSQARSCGRTNTTMEDVNTSGAGALREFEKRFGEEDASTTNCLLSTRNGKSS